jgi:hypothetical protein
MRAMLMSRQFELHRSLSCQSDLASKSRDHAISDSCFKLELPASEIDARCGPRAQKAIRVLHAAPARVTVRSLRTLIEHSDWLWSCMACCSESVINHNGSYEQHFTQVM